MIINLKLLDLIENLNHDMLLGIGLRVADLLDEPALNLIKSEIEDNIATMREEDGFEYGK